MMNTNTPVFQDRRVNDAVTSLPETGGTGAITLVPVAPETEGTPGSMRSPLAVVKKSFTKSVIKGNGDHTSFVRLHEVQQNTLCKDRQSDCSATNQLPCRNTLRICRPKNPGNKNKLTDTTVLNDARTRMTAGGYVAPAKCRASTINPIVPYVVPGPLYRPSCCADPVNEKKKKVFPSSYVAPRKQSSTFPDGKQYRTLATIHPKEAMKQKNVNTNRVIYQIRP